MDKILEENDEEIVLYQEKIDELNRLVKLLSDENFTLRWQLSEQD